MVSLKNGYASEYKALLYALIEKPSFSLQLPYHYKMDSRCSMADQGA